VTFVRDARARGVRTAIVSSSQNCAAVLEAAGLTQLFDVRVDGIDLRRLGLAGKPAPDMFLEAARRLETPPVRAVVCEDALVGVEAGRAGRFRLRRSVLRHPAWDAPQGLSFRVPGKQAPSWQSPDIEDFYWNKLAPHEGLMEASGWIRLGAACSSAAAYLDRLIRTLHWHYSGRSQPMAVLPLLISVIPSKRKHALKRLISRDPQRSRGNGR
jgi:haloacid dehalogenase-like hydrolase